MASKNRVIIAGEVRTPQWFIDRWLPPAETLGKVFVPGCGDGRWAVSALRALTAHLGDPVVAAEQVVGMDLLGDNVKKARRAFEEVLRNAGVSTLQAMRLAKSQVLQGDVFSAMAENLWWRADTVLGNPPYQGKIKGHSRSASAIYHKFIIKAVQCGARQVAMVIPARWLRGGKGLSEFRRTMFKNGLRGSLFMAEYPDHKAVFEEVEISGGVMWFRWLALGDNGKSGHRPCCVKQPAVHVYISHGKETPWVHHLDEFGNEAFSCPQAAEIARKFVEKQIECGRLLDDVRERKQYGWGTNYKGDPAGKTPVISCYGVLRGFVKKNPHNDVDKWRTIIPVACGCWTAPRPNGKIGWPPAAMVLAPGEICTESYRVVGAFDSYEEAVSRASFFSTRAVNVVIAHIRMATGTKPNTFRFFPKPPTDVLWTDELVEDWIGLDDELREWLHEVQTVPPEESRVSVDPYRRRRMPPTRSGYHYWPEAAYPPPRTIPASLKTTL